MGKREIRPSKAVFFFLWVIVPLLFFGCSTAKHVENNERHELHRGVVADTLKSAAKSDRHTATADSISTADSMAVAIRGDTVYIERWHRYTRTRYKVQRTADTVYVEHTARRDTSAVVTASTSKQTAHHTPSGGRLLICLILVFFICFGICKKV